MNKPTVTASQSEATATATDLAAISVSSKIPEFWKDMPKLWFAQFESIMEPQKQGDTAKFNMVIAKLDRDALQQVYDLIITPPEEKKYEALKVRLTVVYEESAERQFNKLVSEMDLGTQRPSQLLRRMSELATNTQVSTEALRRLWISRLPGQVKAVLSVAPDTKLDELAALADKIMENLCPNEIAVVSTRPSTSTSAGPGTSNLNEQLALMTKELQTLRVEINEVRGRRWERDGGSRWNRSRSRSRSLSRGARRTPSSANWLCKYHFRFRNRARTCEKPCSWKQPKQSDDEKAEN